jgi:hypothetical protein
LEEWAKGFLHGGGVHPIVGRTGVFFAFRADVGAVLDTSHIAGVRKAGIAVGPLLSIKGNERACGHESAAHQIVFLFRSITPIDLMGLGQCHHFRYPFF